MNPSEWVALFVSVWAVGLCFGLVSLIVRKA